MWKCQESWALISLTVPLPILLPTHYMDLLKANWLREGKNSASLDFNVLEAYKKSSDSTVKRKKATAEVQYLV